MRMGPATWSAVDTTSTAAASTILGFKGLTRDPSSRRDRRRISLLSSRVYSERSSFLVPVMAELIAAPPSR